MMNPLGRVSVNESISASSLRFAARNLVTQSIQCDTECRALPATPDRSIKQADPFGIANVSQRIKMTDVASLIALHARDENRKSTLPDILCGCAILITLF